ncbi:TetR/AcrR family transcriptional regulator [Ktedonobacteria bacterium brp13]|nr:TetR/AcrR family transcriptional regulator [Ktedonobacteria bacterium brp13]
MSVPNSDEDREARQREERNKKQERADRILDAAHDLVLRYGYKKTTIDDIARQAAVAKGTIYLHWKTRDDLFLDLIVREKLILGQEIQQQMLDDPEGFSLYTLVKYSLLALAHYPLIKALMLQDSDMLGELVTTAYQEREVMGQFTAFETMLIHMREQKQVRTDMTVAEQMNVIFALCIGFITYEQYLPEPYKLSAEASAALGAETLRRTLALQRPDQQEQNDTFQTYKEMLNMAEQYRLRKEHLDE